MDKPVRVRALLDQNVTQVACGGDHSMCINSDGHLFTVSFLFKPFKICICSMNMGTLYLGDPRMKD